MNEHSFLQIYKNGLITGLKFIGCLLVLAVCCSMYMWPLACVIAFLGYADGTMPDILFCMIGAFGFILWILYLPAANWVNEKICSIRFLEHFMDF